MSLDQNQTMLWEHLNSWNWSMVSNSGMSFLVENREYDRLTIYLNSLYCTKAQGHSYVPLYATVVNHMQRNVNILIWTLSLQVVFRGPKSTFIKKIGTNGKRSGPSFIKVKIILSLKFKIIFIFYFVKECKKNMFLIYFFWDRR